MKKGLIIFLFVSSLVYPARSQFLDSIQASINRKGSFSFSFNSRNSSITNHNAYIFGYLIGVRFDRKIGIGGGLNSLSTKVTDSVVTDGQTIKRRLYFSFFSYYVEYLLRLTKHWELDVFLMSGVGNSHYIYTNMDPTVIHLQRMVIPFEPSACIEYDFNKFVGLYVQAGYRWMLLNNKMIHENFNSPTYSFGIAIYPLEIYAALFPNTKLAHIIEDN